MAECKSEEIEKQPVNIEILPYCGIMSILTQKKQTTKAMLTKEPTHYLKLHNYTMQT